MRSPRATTFSIAFSAPESTGAGAPGHPVAAADRSRASCSTFAPALPTWRLQAEARGARHRCRFCWRDAGRSEAKSRVRPEQRRRIAARARRCDPASRPRWFGRRGHVAFGIRNVERPELACAEMARAMRPGGRLAILEFGVPRLPGISTLYLWYFKYLLPRIGRAFRAIGWRTRICPRRSAAFRRPLSFSLCWSGGLWTFGVPLTLGIVYLYGDALGRS